MKHAIDPEMHGPLGKPMADAIQSCVHCGFCLAACPTYEVLGQEMDSPRGRIVLMKSVLEGELDIRQAMPHVDRCLGCLACEPACPSGVAYRGLISPFRAMADASRNRPRMERLRRALISMTLPHPGRFRLAARLGGLCRVFAPWVPGALRPMLELVPASLPPAQSWPRVSPARGARRARVALLAGCAQQVLDPDINTATIDVLTRNGVEVVVPSSQGCCGALSWHVGDLRAARRFALRNLEAFDDASFDAIVTNAAGCGSGMHEYPLILRGTEWEDRARALSGRVEDVSAFLARLGDLAPIPDSGKQRMIAYHDACHLANAQGVRSQPRELLRRIPGVTVVDPPNEQFCCGSAGTYNVDQPETAAVLGKRKAEDILSTRPDMIATGNIGCLTQLRVHLQGSGSAVPVRHTVQILRDAWAGG